MDEDFTKCKKIGVLDIEASALDAQYGYLICACIKEVSPYNLNGPTWTARIDDPRNPVKQDSVLRLDDIKRQDRWLVDQTVEEMNKYDLILTWYGSQYDIPFINTRSLRHRIVPPVRGFRRDLCLCARGFGKLKNNRLATWGSFLFGRSGKSFLNFDIWLGAMRGHKWAIDYIVEHCQKDVLETEKIYKRFTPLLGKLRKR